MRAEQAQERLFVDTVTVEELRGASFALTGVAHRASIERAESLLGALTVIEEARLHEDETTPSLRRIEAKLDVLSTIIARTLLKDDKTPERDIRWSARGAELVTDLYFGAGDQGLLRLVVSDKIPEALQLPARVIASEPEDDNLYRIWLEFVDLGPELSEMLDKHLFRTQRRLIADRRAKATAAAP